MTFGERSNSEETEAVKGLVKGFYGYKAASTFDKLGLRV